MVLTFLILTNSDRIQPGSPHLVLRPSYTTIATRYYLYLAKQSNSATEFYIQYPPVLSSSIPNEKKYFNFAYKRKAKLNSIYYLNRCHVLYNT